MGNAYLGGGGSGGGLGGGESGGGESGGGCSDTVGRQRAKTNRQPMNLTANRPAPRLTISDSVQHKNRSVFTIQTLII